MKPLTYFSFFYHYLGMRVLLALALSVQVAVFDGLGLTMFLPLLQAVDSENFSAAIQGSEVQRIIQLVEGAGLAPNLVSVLLILLTFFILKGIARFSMEYYNTVLQERFANTMRLQTMELLAGYNFHAFSRANSGQIQNTLSGEVNRINMAYRTYFQMLQFLIMTAVYVLMAYLANPKFAVIVAIGGLLSNLVFNRVYKETKKASRRITKEMNTFQGFLIESVSSFKFLKATNLIRKYKERIDESIVAVEQQQRRIGVMNGVAASIREPLVMIVVVIAILVQVMVFEEKLGLIILSLLFFYRGLTALGSMQSYYNVFLGVSGSIENMETFTQELRKGQELKGHVQYTGLNESIEVSGLTYGYDDYKILHDLSVSVKRYETVGLVGESGSGKTTLVNLLCGLLPAPPESIFVDGVDITEIEKSSFRNMIGYVTQESQVFTDTVWNNVTFWSPKNEETQARFQAALTMAHATEFVAQLPQGTETQIGINGINLSGGQRQRISIARELYRKVDLLVLDEATSALDSQSEKLIQENIDTLSGSLTMIIIAHRLSTIRKADKIIFLKKGGEYEIGTFDSLASNSPNFQRMVALQSMG